jgi:peptidoglycan/xylan/chitin deacetylase (PgdA/CDA1 family)
VLMHDGGGNRSETIASLKIIIPELQKRGYRFVTVSELLSLSE